MPLRVVSSKPAAGAISILRVDFQELKYGHEGPSYFRARRPPLRGKQEIAEVALHGQDAIDFVRFELVGEAGQPLEYPVAFRGGSGADANEFMLLVDVPVQAFRFRIAGQDVRGQPFAYTYRQLFVPADGSLSPPELPQGLPAVEASAFRALMNAYVNEVRQQFDTARKQFPNGTIRLARSEVVDPTYEPLFSRVGNLIGIRIHIGVRFGADGDYAIAPNVAPSYADSNWREVTMKVLDASADPAPQLPSGITPHDVLRFGGAARYQAGVLYRFSFELVPSYIIRNAEGTRYCINLENFRAASRLAVWNAVLASSAPVKYRVDIWSLDFAAETADLPPQRTYYENFLHEGAQDCGPNPTIHF